MRYETSKLNFPLGKEIWEPRKNNRLPMPPQHPAVEDPAAALPSEMPRRVLPSSVIGLDLMFSPHLPSFEPAQQR